MSAMNENVLAGRTPIFPTPNLSLGQYMLNCLRSNGTTLAQIDAETGETINYREILEQSIRLAESFKKRGLSIGDRVAISSENRINLIIISLASFYLGIAVAPLNPNYTKAELQHALGISKPSIIFVSPKTENIVEEVARGLNWKLELIQISSEPISGKIKTMAKVIEEAEPVPDLNSYTAADLPDRKKLVAAILCSSGTTGLPKGVMLSHHNLMTLLQHYRNPEIFDYGPGRRLLVLVPYFHGYGFATTLGVTVVKGEAVVMRGFSPQLFLSTIEKYRVVVLPLVPPILIFLAKHPSVDEFDLSSIKEIHCGAAPLSEEIQTAVMKRLGISCIRQGYGMTETTVVISMSSTSENKVGSSGILFPGAFCRIVDIETSKSLGPGQVGEIQLAGDLVMMGYCGNPKATAEAIDKDGWLHTGDIGYYDKDGDIFIVDRIKELIKYKGFQVPPAELEAILLKHPGVKEAAVIGLPDEMAGELPMAFIVRQSRAEVSADEICKFVNDQVNPSKWLRGGVKFVEDIPKNPSGKILRRELRKLVSKL